jgi:hypothetical protein
MPNKPFLLSNKTSVRCVERYLGEVVGIFRDEMHTTDGFGDEQGEIWGSNKVCGQKLSRILCLARGI